MDRFLLLDNHFGTDISAKICQILNLNNPPNILTFMLLQLFIEVSVGIFLDSKISISGNFAILSTNLQPIIWSICSWEDFSTNTNWEERKITLKWQVLHQKVFLLMKSKIYLHVRCVQSH